jgi:hypothetical protein
MEVVMGERPAWGAVSRHCARCGKVGPRVYNPTGLGYIHAYCRSRAETNALAKQRRDARKRDRAELAEQFAADKARYFPEPPEFLGCPATHKDNSDD